MPDQPGQDELLLGGGPDDAGVVQLEGDQVMVQSVDFFTPIVDDPAAYGRIAAANSLSDLYAMGTRPKTALNIVAVPLEEVGRDRLATILQAGSETLEEAGALLVGGHTVKNPEPLYGMTVTGFSTRDNLVTNQTAEPGDILYLSKPLGTGIVTTALKNQEAPDSVAENAIEWMGLLNDVGYELARQELIHSMTDITGYGFLGHAYEMLGEELGARIQGSDLPALAGVESLIEKGTIPGGTRNNWQSVKDRVRLSNQDDVVKWLLADAQTSGGLLVSTAPDQAQSVEEQLQQRGLHAQPVGEVTEGPEVVVE